MRPAGAACLALGCADTVPVFWSFPPALPIQSTRAAFDPFRSSQFLNTTPWLAAGFPASDLAAYLPTALAALSSPNIVMDLRVPSTPLFRQGNRGGDRREAWGVIAVRLRACFELARFLPLTVTHWLLSHTPTAVWPRGRCSTA